MNDRVSMVSSKIALLGLFLFILMGCSITRIQKKGAVIPIDFNFETEFTTAKSVMILPFELDGVTKNFLFDTGAELSLIQRDSITGKTGKYSGASRRKMKLGNEIVASLKLGNVDFTNTVALNGDLTGLKEQIPNFGGIIGLPVISKANWLIDYPNKRIRVSSQNLVENTFQTIPVSWKNGAPYTYISINGVKCKVLIDFGSSSEFNLPKESKLAGQLLRQYDFFENQRERYTIGGIQLTDEKVGVIPLIELGDIDFKNVKTTINVSSQPRIGIGFFRDCIIYIDNLENSIKILQSTTVH